MIRPGGQGFVGAVNMLDKRSALGGGFHITDDKVIQTWSLRTERQKKNRCDLHDTRPKPPWLLFPLQFTRIDPTYHFTIGPFQRWRCPGKAHIGDVQQVHIKNTSSTWYCLIRVEKGEQVVGYGKVAESGGVQDGMDTVFVRDRR